MAIFASIFIFAPQIFTSFVDTFAPTSYFFNLEQIEVGDMQYGTWQQNISIDRTVRKNIFGSPQVEMYVYKDGDVEQARKVTTVLPPIEKILYEKDSNNNVSYIRDWSEKIDKELLESLSLDETYHWLWIIEVELTKNRTEIVHVSTNGFKILPPAKIEQVNIDIISPALVNITQ